MAKLVAAQVRRGLAIRAALPSSDRKARDETRVASDRHAGCRRTLAGASLPEKRGPRIPYTRSDTRGSIWPSDSVLSIMHIICT